MTKIIAINGSPRGKEGNTFIMVESFLKGAKSAGAETEHIILAEKKIHHCIGCFSCWTKTPGVCVFKDDMAPMLENFKCDIVLFATPLYVDNVTGLMKNFMDRMIPIVDPHFEKDPNGECRHFMRSSAETPKIAVMANCGFPEQSHFQTLDLIFDRIARNMHSEVIARIYRGQGELLKVRNLLLMPLQYRYRKLLSRCGEEVVKNGRLSEDSIAKLARPLIPQDVYIKHANKGFDEKLAKI